jgi:hypothetical protein
MAVQMLGALPQSHALLRAAAALRDAAAIPQSAKSAASEAIPRIAERDALAAALHLWCKSAPFLL